MKNLGSFSESLVRKHNQKRLAKPVLSKVEGLNIYSVVKGCLVARLHYRASVDLCIRCQLISSLLFRFFGNFENNLAARVTSRDLFLGLNCFRKRERLRHNHFDFLLID